MKKGFTLIELMVVIGIIGVLMGVIFGTFSGSTESARAARCLSNMKNLANACQSYSMDDPYGCYPACIGTEKTAVIIGGRYGLSYNEWPGWVNWNSRGKYSSTKSQKDSCSVIGFATSNIDDYQYAITNGALYRYVASNYDVYVCPSHARASSKNGNRTVHWSYLMNKNVSRKTYGSSMSITRTDHVTKSVDASRVLLFSEIPFQGPGNWFPEGTGSSDEDDGVLQYNGDGKKETLGCNHKSGKYWVAHIVFADAHIEKLRIAADENLENLTTWLCEGIDVGMSGGHYEKLEN